ncbi:hypothetical protein BSU04_38045 [Caballeronia sordidicola]|uniref:Uncharacterized protein n=1 Tax=Caballeronia sordidicola TaxID=196367 RepID=A0A226WRB5_CABSO|nr:hypothetical protein BSU04_38045 [Caballeronia sordidicola]
MTIDIIHHDVQKNEIGQLSATDLYSLRSARCHEHVTLVAEKLE